MDFEELRPDQQSFELLAAYLNGSTVNVTVDGAPRRYTGAYVTEDFLRILGVGPVARPRLHRRGQPARRREGRAHRPRASGSATSAAPPTSWARACASTARPATDHRRHAPGLRLPGQRGAVDPALQRVPGAAAQRPAQHQPGRPRRAQARGEPRPGERRVRRLRQALRRGLPRHQQGVQHRARSSPSSRPSPRCPARHPPHHAGVLRGRAADRLRQRDEHAVRAGHPAGQGAGGPLLARRHPRAAWSGRCSPRACSWPASARRSGSASPTSPWTGCPPPSGTSTTRRPPGSRFDIDAPVLVFTVGATLVAAVVSGLLPAWMSSRANVVDALKEGGRGNTSQRIGLVTRGLVVFQIGVTCILLIGSLLQVRSILNQQTIDYGYDTGRHHVRPHGPDGRRLPDAGGPPALLRPPAARAARPSRVRARSALTSRFRMVFSGSGPIEIEGKAYKEKRDRPNANFEQVTGGFFEVTGQRILEGRTLHRGRPRHEAAGGRGQRRLREEALRRRRARSAAASGPWTATPRSRAPGGPSSGVVSTVRMLGALQQPERGRHRLLRPVLLEPDRPRAARAAS